MSTTRITTTTVVRPGPTIERGGNPSEIGLRAVISHYPAIYQKYNKWPVQRRVFLALLEGQIPQRFLCVTVL